MPEIFTYQSHVPNSGQENALKIAHKLGLCAVLFYWKLVHSSKSFFHCSKNDTMLKALLLFTALLYLQALSFKIETSPYRDVEVNWSNYLINPKKYPTVGDVHPSPRHTLSLVRRGHTSQRYAETFRRHLASLADAHDRQGGDVITQFCMWELNINVDDCTASSTSHIINFSVNDEIESNANRKWRHVISFGL